MSISRKHKGAFDGVVRAHGIMAGNTLPLRWQDNAGSIKRRLFIIEFNERPPASDGNLLDRLCTVELPFVLRKVNWCYRHACALLDGKDLWQSGYLSDHIRKVNDSVYTSMNSLGAYLADPAVTIAANMWCPLSLFQERFKTYSHLAGKAIQQWTDEFCTVPFKDKNITVRKGLYSWNNEPGLRGMILIGVCPQGDIEHMCEVEGRDNPLLDEDVQGNIDYFRIV